MCFKSQLAQNDARTLPPQQIALPRVLKSTAEEYINCSRPVTSCNGYVAAELHATAASLSKQAERATQAQPVALSDRRIAVSGDLRMLTASMLLCLQTVTPIYL